jgi:cell division septation protein DedD
MGFVSPKVVALSVLVLVSGGSFVLGFFEGKIGRVDAPSYHAVNIQESTPDVINTQEAMPPKEEVFSVQLGAFKNKKDAEALKKRLIDEGYEPFISLENGIHRVRTGSFSNKAEAEALALKIKESMKIEAFVARNKEY